MLKEIILSIAAYRQAHQIITEHKLWKLVILMGSLYTSLFVTGIALFTQFAQTILNQELMITLGIRNYAGSLNFSWLNFLLSFSGFTIWLVFLLCYFALFKYIWLLLGIPMFKLLGKRVMCILEPDVLNPVFPKSHAIKMVLRNGLWQSVYLIALFVVALVPVIGWVVPLFVLLMECYYYGFSMLGYAFSAKKVTVTDSARFSAIHKGFALGNGLVFCIFHLIPFAGWVLAPGYAMVAALYSGSQLVKLEEEYENDE